MAWRQSTGGPEQHLTRAAAAARTRTQRPGKHLAVHASELVVKPDLQILRRYRRPLLLRLEHTHRPTLENHVHRATRLGSSPSLNLRIGIRPTSRMLRPWTRSKKLRRACGGNPREACTRHIGRGLVSRRDAGGPKEQAHLSLGQERFTPPCRPRSTDPIDLSVWCGLSRPWSRRRPRAAGLQLRSHAAPSRRDRNQSRPRSARHYPP